MHINPYRCVRLCVSVDDSRSVLAATMEEENGQRPNLLWQGELRLRRIMTFLLLHA